MKKIKKKMTASLKSLCLMLLTLAIFISFNGVVGIIALPKIAEYFEIKEKMAALEMFDISVPANASKETIREIFSEKITVQDKWNKKVFMYYSDNGALEGYAFVETRKGYGFNKSAPWSIIIGLKPDLETLIGIQALDHEETPGLGGRMKEKWFQVQFRGEKLKPKLTWTRDLQEAEDDHNKFLAITGATNTTKGVEQFIRDVIREIWEKLDKEAAR